MSREDAAKSSDISDGDCVQDINSFLPLRLQLNPYSPVSLAQDSSLIEHNYARCDNTSQSTKQIDQGCASNPKTALRRPNRSG